jgi:multiple sugar transport system permease protein
LSTTSLTRPVLQGKASTSRSRQAHREWVEGYLLMSPWLIGFFLWTIGPMIFSAVMAFMHWEVLIPPKWAGLENVRWLLNDPLFFKSLYNTAYYTFLSVPLRLVVALAAAVVLNAPSRLMPFFRTCLYLPSVMPQVASVILWVWIFNPSYGIANMLLRPLGIPPQMWLMDAEQVKPALVFMSLWYVGQPMVIFLAALQGVPESLKEAALIDGANAQKQFWYVVIPMISPVIFFNLVMGVISSFQSFTTAFMATGGGPNNASLFILLHLYRHAFEYLNMGYASILAWVVFIIILLITIVQVKASNRWVYYEAGLGS